MANHNLNIHERDIILNAVNMIKRIKEINDEQWLDRKLNYLCGYLACLQNNVILEYSINRKLYNFYNKIGSKQLNKIRMKTD